MSPLQAAIALIRPHVEQGTTTTELVASHHRHSGPDFTAGVGVHGGTRMCPGKPGFITVTALAGRPVCHHFGLHQMAALIRNGYPRPGFEGLPGSVHSYPAEPAAAPEPEPAPDGPRQIGLF